MRDRCIGLNSLLIGNDVEERREVPPTLVIAENNGRPECRTVQVLGRNGITVGCLLTIDEDDDVRPMYCTDDDDVLY